MLKSLHETAFINTDNNLLRGDMEPFILPRKLLWLIFVHTGRPSANSVVCGRTAWLVMHWLYLAEGSTSFHCQGGLEITAYTTFLRWDAEATILFAACFVWLLFEDVVHFLGKLTDINNGSIRHIWTIRWPLLDTISSMHSLSVLLSAVETSHTARTALALAW